MRAFAHITRGPQVITPTIDEGRLMGFEVRLPCPTCGLVGCHLSMDAFLPVSHYPIEEVALSYTRLLQRAQAILEPCHAGGLHVRS